MCKKELVGLKPESYEYPLDKETLDTVKRIPLLPKAFNALMNLTKVREDIISLTGMAYRVTLDSCEDLYTILRTPQKRLDLAVMPPIYVQQQYGINAFTMGHENDAYIVLYSGAVNNLTNEELTFVVGHEMGHIKSGHVLYQNMIQYISQLSRYVPGLQTAVALALYKWSRMAEFTADRAGLLSCQDLNVALSALMKMSGLPERFYDKASVEGFKKQIHEFRNSFNGTVDSVIKTMENIMQDHPWTILRAAELIRWYEEGEYQRVIDGCRAKTCPGCDQLITETTSVCPYCGYKF